MHGELMEAEMAQQPQVLAALAGRREQLADVVRAVRPDPLHGTVLVARGSSDHAAILGRYLLEPATRRPVALAAPSLVTLYDAPPACDGFLVVATSQSGRTPEIATVMSRLAATGGRTLAVTNEPTARSRGPRTGRSSSAPATSGPCRPRRPSPPRRWPSRCSPTRSGPPASGAGDWDRLPGAVAEVLRDPAPAERVAEAIGDAPGLLAVARGVLLPVALEAALKLKETAQLLAEGYSAADLRHGPTVVVLGRLPGPGVLRGRAGRGRRRRPRRGAARARRGRARGGRPARRRAALPAPGLPEPLAAIVAAVRAQQVALALARRRGLDPDAPRGLSKVTPTA